MIESLIGFNWTPLIVSLISFIPMLIFLVVVHELGHFVTAKWFGVKVLEFGIGYPPKAFGFYRGQTRVLTNDKTVFINISGLKELQRGMIVKISSLEDESGNLVGTIIEAPTNRSNPDNENMVRELSTNHVLNHTGKVKEIDHNGFVVADMLYSLNWTPLGGFVRLAGENDPDVPRSLASKGIAARVIVLAAGSFMNAILPILIFTILFMIPQDKITGNILVTQVFPKSPAELAGIQSGDIILQSDGKKVDNLQDLVRQINFDAGSEIQWIIERSGRQVPIDVTPRMTPPTGQGPTGISIDIVNPETTQVWHPPWTAMYYGVNDTWELLVLLKREISSWLNGTKSPELSGPIGIAQITGEVTQEGGYRGWLILAILFSINLAILNILPIPMLDGGRLLFVVIEWIRKGKRIPPDKENIVHLVGFAVLIGLIILISTNDISRLLNGNSLLGG